MAKVTVVKEKNYTTIDNGIFKDTRISFKAKGLLTTMLSLPPTWNYTIEGLATLSKDGRDSIKTALKELEKFGYLERKQIRNDNGSFCDLEYFVYEKPQTKEPLAENPLTDKPSTKKSSADNRIQLNTDILNTNNKYSKDKNTNISNTDKYAFPDKTGKDDGIYSSSPEVREDEAKTKQNRFIPSDYSYKQLREHILTPIGECVQSEFGGESETINIIADIVVQFCKDYESCFGRKHKVPTDDACKNIVFQFYNPPEVLDGINDFDSYVAMMEAYLKTNFNQSGRYDGTIEKSVSHFMSRKVRENLYYKTLY